MSERDADLARHQRVRLEEMVTSLRKQNEKCREEIRHLRRMVGQTFVVSPAASAEALTRINLDALPDC